MNIRKFYITGEGIGGGNATPVKAIYLDEFIYEEGTPIGKCYQCHLPNPFTNNQVLTEGIDYVKQWQVNSHNVSYYNCSKEEYEGFTGNRRIICLPVQPEGKEGEKERCEYELIVEKFFGIKVTSDNFNMVIGVHGLVDFAVAVHQHFFDHNKG